MTVANVLHVALGLLGFCLFLLFVSSSKWRPWLAMLLGLTLFAALLTNKHFAYLKQRVPGTAPTIDRIFPAKQSPPLRHNWPEPTEADKPQETIDEKILLARGFYNRIRPVYSHVRDLSLDVRFAIEENYFRTRPDPGLEPRTLYVSHPDWTALAFWWDQAGHVYFFPVAREDVSDLYAELDKLVAQRQDSRAFLEQHPNDEAVRKSLAVKEKRIEEIVVRLGHDVLCIPYDSTTHRFRFGDPKPDKAPEVVERKLLEMYYALTERDWLNNPFVAKVL